VTVDVKQMPGLEQLPFAEVWFRSIDEAAWRQASAAARGLGKSGLEVWTTTETPVVVAFLAARGYEEVRRYVVSELDVAAASAPEPPGHHARHVRRPARSGACALRDCAAVVSRPARPVRADHRELRVVAALGPRRHPPDAYFIALEGERVLGYGFLEIDGETGHHGFTAIGRAERGGGVASAIKRAQIAWAKEHGLRRLKTANETRLTGMLALNARHGYRPLYEEIVLRGPAAAVESPA
jgi:GNAT superfamily N-acetyltransferase